MLSARHRFTATLIWVLLTLFASSVQAEQALLWRVETPKGAVSYLFGTIHSEDPRVTNLPAPITHHFEESKTVVLEMAITPELQQQMAQAVLLPPDKQLSGLLPEKLYRKTIDAMSRRGYPEEVVQRLQPWAVILTLSMPTPKTGEFLDKVLYQRALTAGKTVKGLETGQEQLAIFRDLSLQEQQELLRQTLNESSRMPEYMESLTQAWLDRDMDRVMALNKKNMSELPNGLRQRFGRSLVEERNHRMAERSLPILRQGGAFIAVGTLHLLGDEGLVALFRDEGMKVTPVY